jgi:hypothetical protein
MKVKTVVIVGIITYVLSVFASAENEAGNNVAPTSLIIASALATLIFTLIISSKLWKSHRVVSVLLFVSNIITLVYISGLTESIYGIVLIWAIVLLWKDSKVPEKMQIEQ